jgi:hypothetical protein
MPVAPLPQHYFRNVRFRSAHLRVSGLQFRRDAIGYYSLLLSFILVLSVIRIVFRFTSHKAT